MESIKERKSCSEEGGSELEITISGSSTTTSGKQPDDNNNIVKKNIHLDLSSSDSQEELNDDVDEKYSTNLVHNFQVVCSRFFTKHKKAISMIMTALLVIGYFVYFSFAIMYDFENAIALIACTGVVVACIIYHYGKKVFGDFIDRNCLIPLEERCSNWSGVLKWFAYPLMIIGAIFYMSMIVIKDMKQIQPIIGMIIFTLITFITSKHPNKIVWRPVIWGFSLQFIFAIFILRWQYGYLSVKFLADQINTFIEYGYDGAAVVFGDPSLMMHPFAMMGMSLLIYLGAVMAMLYYGGLTQTAAVKLGWILQKTMGTTAIETLNTAANIFLDGMDTMLMLRYYIDKLTLSEFNCFLVGNHATVAGFVFALFILFGAPPQHLLSAAVMSAPATIAICKLNYPETEESQTKRLEDIDLPRRDDVNIFEAAANGCNVASKVVCSVLACYISMMALLAFLNATLEWLGTRVGYPQLSFELICSFVLWPIAFVIGVDAPECKEAAKLIGIKLFATEILAYQELGKSVARGLLSPRNQALTTYAMCGFSSISTLAISIGVWNALCPQRVKLMASFMLRALVEANISCFMTACVAGIFYSEEIIDKLDLETSGKKELFNWLMSIIPGYESIMGLIK